MLRHRIAPTNSYLDRLFHTVPGRSFIRETPASMRPPLAILALALCALLRSVSPAFVQAQSPTSIDVIAVSATHAELTGSPRDTSLQPSARKQVIWEVVVLRYSTGPTTITLDPSSIICDS